jgi:hypothetical protein
MAGATAITLVLFGVYYRHHAELSVAEHTIGALGTLYISYQILRAGFDTFRIVGEEQSGAKIERILRFDSKSDIGSFFLKFLGIPSICWQLPVARRVLSISLFLIATLTFSFFVVMLWSAVMAATPVFGENPARCFFHEGNAAKCWLNVIPATLAVFVTIFGFFAGSLTLAAVMRYIARRFSRISLERLISKDARALILFLRSFRDDQVRLIKPRQAFFRRMVSVGEPRPTLDHVLLEEGTSCGPVVALGAPGSTPPFGAARKYVTHDEWRDTVVELCRKAGAVVIVVDETDGVRWEVQHLIGANSRTGNLFLVPPRLTRPDELYKVLFHLFSIEGRAPRWVEELGRFLESEVAHCVGWFWRTEGEVQVMSTNRVSSLSYRIAVRRFLLLQRLGVEI